MLTRLKVQGFKNLADVDVRFGPFTCLAGVSGSGKSNLFDAITFLAALSQMTIAEAAKSVRSTAGRSSDVRSLFCRSGESFVDKMAFEAEMIIPESGFDDLGHEVHAKITLLRYQLTLGYKSNTYPGYGGLEILCEDLSHINLGSASQNLLFPHKVSAWRHSAVKGRRSGGAFISTQLVGEDRIVELHTDGDGGGRPRSMLASHLQRTVLSSVNTAENPTVLLVKREMQAWHNISLEPAALRMPDESATAEVIGNDGSHLPAVLYHIWKSEQDPSAISHVKCTGTLSPDVFGRLTGIINSLGYDLTSISVEFDQSRETLTLLCKDANGVPYDARALPNGLLRTIAFAVIAFDRSAPTLIFLDDPENGINPEMIPGLINLLSSSVVDVNRPVGPDNTLRQLIITTHSPIVLSCLPDDDIIIAERVENGNGEATAGSVRFSCLANSWRERASENINSIERERISYGLAPSQSVSGEKEVKESREKPVGVQGNRKDKLQVQPDLPL